MRFRITILIYLLYIPSSLLTVYLSGLANISFGQDGILDCFCWDLCRVAYWKRLVLVLTETIPSFLFFRYLINYELKKSILLGLIVAFVLEFILYEFSIMFGTLFWGNQVTFKDVIYPIYVAFDKMLYVGIILAIVLVLLKSRLKNAK